jgi:hypothetical protein
MSEFGLQALPDTATLTEMFGGDIPASLDDPRWAERKLQVDKLRHYLGPAQEGDLRALVEASQRVQAAVLQTGIETCRVRREGSPHGEPCGGVAFWQFNEPWPAVTWSVLERSGRPKAAYEMLKSSYAPLLVAARFRWKAYRAGDLFEVEVWAVNDMPAAQLMTRVIAEMDGKPVWEGGPREIKGGSAAKLGVIGVRLDAAPRIFTLDCVAEGEMVARNSYDLAVYLPPAQRAASRLLRRVVDRLLEIG